MPSTWFRNQEQSIDPFLKLNGKLNGFKQVNDTFGHHVGDQLLVEVARRLAEVCCPAGFPGRLGGDEFLILLPEPAPVKAAVLVQALLSRIAAPIAVARDASSSATITTTASAGIATTTPESMGSAQLRQADIALYHAKDHPGGIVLFQKGMQHPRSAPGRRSPTPAAEPGS